MKTALLLALSLVTVAFAAYWSIALRRLAGRASLRPAPLELALGFITNFFDTLGIGSFAPTTAVFKLRRMVPDELIPGTLNVGHALPTIAQAFIFIVLVPVDPFTLALLVGSATLGAWFGAGRVSQWPRRRIQIGLGAALLIAGILFAMASIHPLAFAGTARALDPVRLVVGCAGVFLLGAFMTLGIGLYAPGMMLVGLLGMHPAAAFPIVTASCAFLMPAGSVQFISRETYAPRAALGLTLAGVPAVVIAAYLVRSLPLAALRWMVTAVVLYTAIAMLRAARKP